MNDIEWYFGVEIKKLKKLLANKLQKTNTNLTSIIYDVFISNIIQRNNNL